MKLQAQITFRDTVEAYERLQKIAASERRKMNEVARALLERGLAAYERDGQLFEPAVSDNGDGKQSGKHRVRVEHGQREHPGKRKAV